MVFSGDRFELEVFGQDTVLWNEVTNYKLSFAFFRFSEKHIFSWGKKLLGMFVGLQF